MSCSVDSGNLVMKAHFRPFSDIPPNRTASLRNAAQKSLTVSPDYK